MTDALVEEVRRAGQAYIASFKGDREALLADLRKRQQQETGRVISLSPKPPRHRTPDRS